ncbi:hydroxymethylglutaryl-CoA lyase [Roseibium hamelinense]|uniref:Hydroxymethylglutaryl-CoA lyase n=1 Tax=Roseibium hamelinense TaxID=150831 RepID=A0A562SFA1_9HYPH|nr:hydroxymethylglutaryl-CoA lyase [Roseibium hamelinense]MTI42886.1 hydroxymethylglutaryl-CoA lyase [Roseibium hamelinense]TWI79918.1 hydroxymethylglutaryl-CoA lyase [Roseibium hamelinense]
MSEFVTIFEMGPRDGLQNETNFVPTGQKIELVDRLSGCGFRKIEVTSFVSPKWVPQMADAQEVMEGIYRHPAVTYSVLTPNVKGYGAAVRVSADEVAIFGSASEGFSRKNINCSVAESIERFKPLIEKAQKDAIPVRGYVSCVTDCPYDGATSPAKVAEVAKTLFDLGCYEISLGDTIGAGTPETIGKMLDTVLGDLPAEKLAGHFHDTKGRALENIEISLDKGLRTFDSAVGGLGGCPYAPGAKGNVATEAVAALLSDKGFETGLDMDKLKDAAAFARSLRGASA